MRAFDRALYVLFAATATLVAARTFYSYMLIQTGGEWSAPLDDVFIHFDYARATARGHPFEWSEGNGYSSGNTSLLYPFALAVGYRLGFTQQHLMVWAAIVACFSVLALLLVARRLFRQLPAWSKYLAPPILLGIGALEWNLWSGMEVAFFLGIWAITFRSADRRCQRIEQDFDAAPAPPRGPDQHLRGPDPEGEMHAFGRWELGFWGAVLVATRPEAATSIAVLGITVAVVYTRRSGFRAGAIELLRSGLPSVVLLVVQSITNRLLTGEWSASGTIVKLAWFNPYMPIQDKLAEYRFLLEYVIRRNVEHHFTTVPLWGWLVPLVGAVPLVSRATRRNAIVLWACALSWLALVATNGQVRWQNERYTMPAVAWVLLLAAMGVAVLIKDWGVKRGAPAVLGFGRLARIAVMAGLVVGFWHYQAPCMRDQIWFFGRACRNIRDQHVTAGRLLSRMNPRPRRILMGDAGALAYASDLPGLDIIGLGGYHNLPFARAGVHGLGASLELIERMPREDWPDIMAIYASWWGDLPTWFGKHLLDVPVRGNVICGGAEKSIYRTDWSALGTGAEPRTLRTRERIVDELDVADLVSEKEHEYEFPHPGAGFVDAKVLGDPADAKKDMFDAGRRIPGGRSERFRLRGAPDLAGRLILRTTAEHALNLKVTFDGNPPRMVGVPASDGWQELSVDVPITGRSAIDVELGADPGPDWVDYHVWLVQAP